MAKREKNNYIIQTVVHALDILEEFRNDANELGVTELSRRLRLDKNNVFRLLVTLESRNYIEQNKRTENYRLGLKNLELGQTVIKQLGLHRQAKPVLESLARDCNETCLIAIRTGSYIIYLDAVESTHPVRVVPRVGTMLPAHCTAAGKVLLAEASDLEGAQHLPAGELQQRTPHTVNDRGELAKQLEAIAIQGYALEDEELDVGVRGVAAPLRDYGKGVVGAICVSGPTMRFSKTRMQEVLVPLVMKAGEEISARLGYCSPAAAAINA